jgi:hypothetical protein
MKDGTGKDLEGSGRGPRYYPRRLSGRTEEHHKKTARTVGAAGETQT